MKEKTLEQRLYHSYGLGCILVIIISMSITLYYSIAHQQQELDDTITGIAALVAETPMVISALEEGEENEALTAYLDQMRASLENLDIITVCRLDSIRLYHPEKSRIGQRFVGGDEADILSGAEPYITDGEGTLGRQRRAFHSVKDGNGNRIGFVMVSILADSIRVQRNQILVIYGFVAAAMLGIGSLLAGYNMRYLRRLLMGYKPEEFVTKYMEHSEVFDALDEGIFAISPEGRVTLMNQSARDMLGLARGEAVDGRSLMSLYPDTKLPEVMKTGQPEYNATMLLGGNHILTSRIPLKENGKIVGAVAIFRNKTEVMRLAEELTGARDMLDTLRAFNHEFMNKLHVILGYLQLGDNEKAMEYIANTTLVSNQAVRDVSNQIQVSHLSALIIGKMMRASEMGIRLTLKQGSHCGADALLLPMDCYVTVIGNLVENALEELNSRNYPVREIELGIYCEADCTVITCEDTGGGIPEAIRERIFQPGVSTKGEARGTGLPLVKDIADRYRGEISLETEPGEGTCITVSFIREKEGRSDVQGDDCGG